ncbi:DNA cytosine methyltransferase [Microbacterium forte]|uniref:DNA cytosine methyltransferase n=1 Tax=Microbacterium forte TaxID=2982533 RepID=UPI0028936069|nr:DNA cytosine methyltransferase [Microbacterium sp. A(2022)]
MVSLFAGAGGLDLGFKQTGGFRTVWANDNDPDAVSTFSSNFDVSAKLGDIRSISSSEIPDCDVVIGGFPCQGFSVANTGRRVDDARNALYLEMLRVVRDKRPLAFVAENVKGLKQMAKGEVLRRILDDFRELGYDVQYQLVNAADYGVPQRRERVIIVGTRADEGITFNFPDATHSPQGGNGKSRWITSGEALSEIPDPDSDNDLLNHTYSRYKLRFNGYIGNRSVDPDLPAPTVTGRGDNRGGVVVLHHPSNTRRMSVRELATIQSFPLDFYFSCNQSAAYRLIGNAVPPALGNAVGGALLRALSDALVVPDSDVKTYAFAG